MNVKNKISYCFNNFYLSIEDKKFTLVLVLSIVFGLYGSFTNMNLSYIDAFISTLNNPIYIILLLVVMLLNTKNNLDLFKNRYEYTIRFNNKKEIIINLIKTILFNNFIVILLNYTFLIIFLNFFNVGESQIPLKSYNINHIIYLIFCLIKFIILSEGISIICFLLFCKFNKKIIVATNLLFYVSFYILAPNNTAKISNIKDIPININYYLFSYMVNYSSFLFEILLFILYCLIFCGIIYIVFKIIVKKIGDL